MIPFEELFVEIAKAVAFYAHAGGEDGFPFCYSVELNAICAMDYLVA